MNLDIPCDVRARDTHGRVWAFVDEAADPASIRVGEFVLTGDETNPVVARVREIADRPCGQRS